jgi:hypothetical protein
MCWMNNPLATPLALSLLLASGCAAAAAPPARVRTDPMITNALIDLVERSDHFKVDFNKVPGTPLSDILSVGSPIGYDLRNRYLNIGIPLTEGLSRDPDPVFQERLVNVARWEKYSETRSAALIALAGARDLAHLDVFREAIAHRDPAVRFATLEALPLWGHDDKALPLLAAASERDPEPILRVYAAAGLLRLGDASGLPRLRAFLEDQSWLVRAMSARYLGEFGSADDYRTLVSRIPRETGNDFVAAEYCIAALKLFPKVTP